MREPRPLFIFGLRTRSVTTVVVRKRDLSALVYVTAGSREGDDERVLSDAEAAVGRTQAANPRIRGGRTSRCGGQLPHRRERGARQLAPRPRDSPVRLTTKDGNVLQQELQKELAALGEILTEFQQQNDNIRVCVCALMVDELQRNSELTLQIQDALLKRPRVPEPPGRPLLLEKLKMLATDLHRSSPRIPVQSHKEMEILEYVLSAGEDSNGSYDHQACRGPPSTPRMVDLRHSVDFSDRQDGAVIIPIRPGTSGGAKRPLTSGSQRPISRGSTVSMSSVSTLLDSAEVLRTWHRSLLLCVAIADC